MIKSIVNKPDTVGAIASTLCIVHCLATPLIFMAHTCAIGGCKTTPIWWANLDFIFLMISFLAIKRAVKKTSIYFIKPALWINWSILLLLVVNEKQHFTELPEILTYICAISLAVIHIYNLKYCQCKNDTCCTNHG